MTIFRLATSLQPDGSFAFTATVVVAGIGIVLLTLALLIAVFSAFGKLLNAAENRAKAGQKDADSKPQIPAPPVIASPAQVPPPPVIEGGVPSEVVAAITAAVAALDGDGARIKAVRKAPRRAENPWAEAARIQNTQPF